VWVNKLETIQYSCGKAALGLHGSPAAVGVRAELGLEELRFRRQALKLRWWARLCDAPQERLMSLLFRVTAGEFFSCFSNTFFTFFYN
jgi:hypothetical protein